MARLSPGEQGIIRAVHAEERLQRRLAALGIKTGRPVQVLRRARFGGPMHLRIGSTEVMLRPREAERIDVIRHP
ncbi:MAG: ferrous iron transport protein A [Gammaproteobacteria bacterium]|nr:MAG: ferrous iron transport protein A [Gammaproteobacteria bacterium]